MIKYLQLPFRFDGMRLQEEVNHINASSWTLHFQKLHYEGDWSALPLRNTDGKASNIYISDQRGSTYKNTELLASCPYIANVLDHFKCPLKSVRLMKLKAGAIIKEHRDNDLYFEKGEVRIHIPVITNKEVEFYLENERISLNEGECWYMNLNLPHRISNNSKADRIHLVIDAEVNNWLSNLFSSKTIITRKDIDEPGEDPETLKQMLQMLREMNTPISNALADDIEKKLSAAG